VPAVALNDAGAAAVVFQRADGSTNCSGGACQIAQINLRPAGGNFAAAGTDLSATGQNASGPGVAIDPSGRSTAVWVRSDGTHTRIQSRFASAAGVLSGVDTISDPAEDASGPAIAVDNANTAIAAWIGCTGGSCVIEGSSRASNASFGAVQKISAPGTSQTVARIAVNGAGAAVAVWGLYDGTNTAIQSASRPAGGAFGGVQTLSANSSFLSIPSVAVDDQGDAQAAWNFFASDGKQTAQTAAYDAAPPVISNMTVPAAVSTGTPAAMSAQGNDRLTPVTLTWDFGDGSGAATGASVSHTYAAPGTFTVRVTARDGVGNTRSDTRTIQVTTPPPPPVDNDKDKDGYPSPADCNDDNAAIHPGAVDIPADKIDQNCDGQDAKVPRVGGAVTNSWSVSGAKLTVLVLKATGVPKGATIKLTCSGKRCPLKKSKSIKVKKAGTVDLRKALGKKARTFRAGQTLIIRITAPGTIGKEIRFPLKRGKIPKGTVLCVQPGAKKATKC
jgi:hypothetical protein